MNQQPSEESPSGPVGPEPGIDQSTVASTSESARYAEPFRPQFHFSPESGWIGDPDGMIRYNDTYHVFWWGHAESSDLVTWTQRPYPMRGDDGSFVYFSGSVVVDELNSSGFGHDERPPMIAIYTMHNRETGHEDQGLSVSHNYTEFQFIEQNPVLDAEQDAFRDPQVFYSDKTERWIMVITLPEDRMVRFYASRNLRDWTHLSDFGPVGARSQVWEVPDLIRMPVVDEPGEHRWVLLCGMGPNRTQYFVGDFDGKQFTLDASANGFLLAGEGLPGTVIADFDAGMPADWAVEGVPTPGPDALRLEGASGCSGYIGTGYLSTASPGYGTMTNLPVCVTSSSFTVEHSALNFLVSGGGSARTSVDLIVDSRPVRSERGTGEPSMRWVGWDISDLRGAKASLRITDSATDHAAGAINVDHIVLSDQLMQARVEHANWLDYGPDYYAVRTYRDYDRVEDRTVALGWMGNWEYARDVPTSWGKGALALPRELALKTWDGGLRLAQQPISALHRLRGREARLTNLEVSGAEPIPGFVPEWNQYEIDVTFTVRNPVARVGITLAIGRGGAIRVGVDRLTSNVFLDRTNPENGSFSAHFPKYVTAPVQLHDDCVRLHLYVDRSSVEVFVNDGEATVTAVMFPDPKSTELELFAEGGRAIVESLRAWELTSIWSSQQ